MAHARLNLTDWRIALDEINEEELFDQHMKENKKKLKIIVVLFALLFIVSLWTMLS
jgi:hypothetical protein